MLSNLRISLLLFAISMASITFCSTEFLATTHAQEEGEDGADGIAGDPGTHGEDGTDSSDTVQDIEETNSIRITGLRGGHGGTGGAGVDDDDEGTSAQGGNGGHAGHGGNVRLTRVSAASNYATTAAIGGFGGTGGAGGVGTSTALTGTAGNGGHGGNASIRSELSFSQGLTATGGRGGWALGTNAVGGDGGKTFLSGEFLNDLQNASLFQIGGSGGGGLDGASGGQGASSTYGYNSQHFAFAEDFDGESSRSLSFYLNAGRGGDSYNGGQVGRGGTARLNLESLADAGYQNFSISASIYAGQGGRGISTGNQTSNGTSGSIAVLKTGENQSLASSSFYIRGGNGSSALGRQNTGDGGNGAAAIVDGKINIADERTFLTLNMRGGSGGHAQGSGWSGNGASVIAPEINLSGSGISTSMNVDLFGGNGGWGRRNGSGGNAIAQYEGNNAELETELAQGYTFLRARSLGGNAGRGRNAVNSATGGNAVAEISETRSSALDITSIAQAGLGYNGDNGDATAKAFGHSTFDERLSTYNTAVNTSANASGRYSSGRPSRGTNSTAEATSINENSGSSFASSSAIGSWGFLEGGDAHARATAQATKESYNASASARSSGAGSTNETDGNIAESNANASTAIKGTAEAIAISSRIGHDVTAKSTAVSTGDAIYNTAQSSTHTSSWNHTAIVETTTVNDSHSDEQIISAENISLVQFRSTEAIEQPVFEGQMAAALLVNPVKDQIASFVENESDFGDVFLGADSDVIGVGSLVATGSEGGSLDSSAIISLNLEVQEYQSGGRFQVGFFGLDESAGGFEELSLSGTLNGRELFNEQWIGEDVAVDAMTFFDNLLLDAMDTPTNLEVINLEFNFSSTSTLAGDSFGLGFVFGNVFEDSESDSEFAFKASAPQFNITAVPEPGSMAILMSIGMLAAVRRRR